MKRAFEHLDSGYSTFKCTFCFVQYFSLVISLKIPQIILFYRQCLSGFACLHHFICLANLLPETILLWLSYREVPWGRTLGSKLLPVFYFEIPFLFYHCKAHNSRGAQYPFKTIIWGRLGGSVGSVSDSWFWLRSWSHGSWVQALCQALCWWCRVYLGFPLPLCLPLSLTLSLSQNKYTNLKKKNLSSGLECCYDRLSFETSFLCMADISV